MDGKPLTVLAGAKLAGDAQVQLLGDPEPIDIEVENLGFLSLNRDKRVRLIPEAFPLDALPPSSSSLFAIANRRGIFAAAGPKSFVIGSTASLREAFTKNEYTPELSIPSPINISHVAFNADESHLILGISTGGLAIYSIDDLSNGAGEGRPTFEVRLDDALRDLKPNPIVPELVAVLTMDRDVRILDLNSRLFKSGESGSILNSNVGAFAWSKLGKQIICGLVDGTCRQMTPDGVRKAELPAPPGLQNYYVSNIVWLTNHEFLVTHTPIPTADPDYESVFHSLTRNGNLFQFIKIFDPVPPFGVTERVPPFFFTAQLRQYDPGLKDVVIYANSCSSDIGVIVRYSKPSNDIPAETFIVAQLPDDTRRAQMPLPTTDGVQDTSPTGMAIDFSNKAAVERPIGTDEVEKSPGPLPILMVLSHEGFLSAWNIVYNDAIRTGNNYSGMAVYESNQSTVPQSPVPTTKPEVSPLVAPQSTTSGLGQTPFSANPTTTASPFAVAPTTPKAAFGASPGFGQLSSSSTPFRQPQPSATSGAFGQPPTLSSSRWNSTPSKPAFGQPSFGQTSFGQASQLRAGTTAPAAPLTGFGAGAGFAAFAGKGGFAAAAASASNTTQGGSIFGSGKSLATSTESVFGSGNTAGSEAFGSGNASNFKIGSAFKPVPSQANDSKQDDNSGSLGGIGMSLGGALVGSAAKSPSPANAPGSTPGMPASKPTPPTTSLPFSATPTASQQSPFTGYEGAGKGLFAPNPFTSVSTPKSAFGTPATPSGAFGFPSGSKTVAGSPSPAPVAQLLPDSPSPVPIAQLSPDFTKTPTKPKSLLSNAKDQSESAPALPSAPVQSLSDSPTPEEAPLPPDFVTLQNEAEPQDLPHLADNQSDESGDEFEEDEVEEDEQGDGEDGEGEEEEGEYQEEESEYQEEEGEYQEEESEYQEEEGEYQEEEGEYQEEDEVGEGPDEGEAGNRTAVETPKPANKSTLQPKKTTTPSNTSSVFDANTTYSNTFGDGGIQEGALFSHFCGKQQGEESSDQDDKDGDEEPVQLPSSSRGKGGWVGAAKGGISDRTKPAKKMSCNLPGGTGASKLARRLSVEKAAGMFTPKTDNEKTFSLPETQIGSFSESDKENRRDDQKAGWNASEGSTLEKPLFSSFTPPSKLSNALSQSRPSTPQSAQNLLSAFPGVSKSPVVGRASPVPRMANPLSLVSPHQTSTPEPPAEDAVSVVDFDAEYSDHEDEKIREQLLHGEIKPSDTLPEVKKLKEIEVPEPFEEVFDSIYLSGNMMVNKLGQMVRSLQSYHLAQKTPAEGVTHESATDMIPTDDWRLCEMSLIGKTINELLKDVRKINNEKPALEKKRLIASKGFIKLDTKESEIKRLFAVHNDPAAAARARARLLAPEQQIQQRQLRKSFTRVEKALKATEYKATMFKAKIAARDRHRTKAKFQPPTVEAVRTTVMKLTAMAEKKNKDVDVLEEKLRRVRLGNRSRSMSATPGRHETPERELVTPAQRAGRYGTVAPTPVLALIEEGDVDELREEQKRRREAVRKLRGALQSRGGRLTDGGNN